ncbi:MAG: hypothetical protein Kow0092_16380 [Deferrisomatales bacterium]
MRILIAERDPVWQRRWREAGVPGELEIASDGAEALRAAFRDPPAAVVCEALLPGLDGLAVVRRLREHPLTRHVPVAVVSALPFEDRAREAGADLYRQKPLSDADLAALVAALTAPHP